MCACYHTSMTRKEIGRDTVILLGTSGMAGALFWMAVYLAGPLPLLPGAVALVLALAWLTRHADHGVALAERAALAGLLAAQASLLAAIVVHVLPVVARHLA